MEIELLLVKVASSLTESIVGAGLRAFLTRPTGAVSRAIQRTSRLFPEIAGTEAALQRWANAEAFSDFIEQVQAGERPLDGDVIASFVEDGGFYFPTEDERLERAAEVIEAFLEVLVGEIYDSDGGLLAFGNRQEALHRETTQAIIQHQQAQFKALEAKLSGSTAPKVTLPESHGHGPFANPTHQAIAVRIDSARDLINRGHVNSARIILDSIEGELGELPAGLKFRLLTNLAACALAGDCIDRARALLEEAHSVEPENQKGIANAALAALLAGNPEAAVELAAKARQSTPHDSQATAVLIEGLWEAGKTDVLDEFVAAEDWIARDRHSSLALAGVRVRQSRLEEAVALCRSLVEADAQDFDAHLAFGYCLLRYSQGIQLPQGLEGEAMASLHEAEVEADRAANLLRPTDLKSRYHEAVVVRAIARAILGKTAAAMQDLDEVLSEASGDPDAAFNKGLLLLSEAQPAEARTTLEAIQDPVRRVDTALPLAHAYIALGEYSKAGELLSGSLELEHPRWEEVQRAELLVRAEAAAGDEDSVGHALAEALEKHPDDPRLLTIAATRHDISGSTQAAEESFLKALEHAGQSDRHEVLLRLGTLYIRLKRHREAAELLTEVVAGIIVHPAAIPLLICLVDSNRLRQALDWARKIRSEHPQPPRVATEVQAQILDQVGDARAVLLCFEGLCSRTDSTSLDRVQLALAHYRCGERDAALSILRAINIADLSHHPRSILAIAQLKRFLDESGYLEDAYLARRYGLHDPTVHLGYFSLFLGQDHEWVEPETVGPGCAVLLRNGGESQWWQILEEREESNNPHELLPDSDLARRLLGRHQGDTVILREGFEDLSYEIVALQSKFVRAFQEISEDFSTRFPEDTGLSRIDTADDDFTKILLSVDRRDQLVRQAQRVYQQGQLPFSSFASLLGVSALEAWLGCTGSASVSIRFGIGTSEEESEASDLLRQSDGVILDLLALLTVHELGLAETLRRRFSRIAVPQHVVDELEQVWAQSVIARAPASSLHKTTDGQYILTPSAEEGWLKWRDFARSVLEFARSFESIASYRMLDVDDAQNLTHAITLAGAGAICAGDENPTEDLVIVSDDLGLSSVARSLGISTVNSQAVLRELHRTGAITGDAYPSYIERLTLLNYQFVQVRSEDLVRRLESNGYMTTDGTRAMLKTLEGPHCTEDSAISVGADLIISLEGRAPRGQSDLLLMAMLATLKQGRELSPVLLKFRNEIASRLRDAPLTRNQLLQVVDYFMHLVNMT